MIKQIGIINFQSHKKTELEFDKGINLIIGKSDSGKTSILRSINWIVNNRPLGESYRSRWGGDTKVWIDNSNYIIEKIKTKKENYYRTSLSTGKIIEGQIYRASGTEVPKPITEILNFRDINIQTQTESSFLLSSSSGEVARYLNQIVNLDKIDIALSNIEKRKRENNRNLTFIEKEINNLKEEVGQFDFLDKLETQIENLEKKYKVFSNMKEEHSNLHILYTDLIQIKTKLDYFSDIENKNSKINELIKILKKIEIRKEQTTILFDMIDSIECIQDSINTLIRKIEQKEKVDYNINLISKIEEKENKKKILNQVIVLENKITFLEKEKKVRESKFNKLFPDICPLCSRPI